MVTHRDHVSDPDSKRSDIHAPAIDLEVAMIDHLPCLHQGAAESGTEGNTVETCLEQGQQVVTRHATHLLSFAKGPAELFFEQSIGVPQFLFLDQLLAVIGDFAAALVRAMLTGTVTAALEQPVVLGVAIYVDTEASDEFAFGTCKLGHSVDFSSVWLKTVFISIKSDLFCQLYSTHLFFGCKAG